LSLSLRTRIDRNHVVSLREVVDLLLPNPCRHRPSRNENDWPPTAYFDVVDPDAIRSSKKSALVACAFALAPAVCIATRLGSFHVRSSAGSSNCTASCLRSRRVGHSNNFHSTRYSCSACRARYRAFLVRLSARIESFADIILLRSVNDVPASSIGATSPFGITNHFHHGGITTEYHNVARANH